MATKRQAAPRKKLCVVTFTKAKAKDGTLFIEGWANKAVVDRGKDLLKKEAWKLDNFQKNPMILFNHDKMQPIGKAIIVEARDEGLYIKAQISKSDHPDIRKVRDLIGEGVLNAFSVGFDAKEETKDGSGGVNEIKDAELYEVSIVSIPMNQDSLFSVTTKDLAGLKLKDARKIVLREKGAWVASAIHDKVYALQEEGGFDRAAALVRVAEGSGASPEELTNILAGNVTPVPEEVLVAFAEVLGLDPAALKKLDEGDVAAEGSGEGAEKPDEEEKPAEDEKPAETPPSEDEKPEDEDEKTEDKPDEEEAAAGEGGEDDPTDDEEKDVHAVMVPKADDMDETKAAALIETAGYKTDSASQTETHYVFEQRAAEEFEGDFEALDVEGGVILYGKPKKKKEGDEEKPKPEDEEETKASDAPTTPVPLAPSGEPGNPVMEQQRQTNVLLGTVIQVLQTMAEKLDKIAAQPVVQPAPGSVAPQPTTSLGVDDEEEDDPALAKMMTNLRESQTELDRRLKNLGV